MSIILINTELSINLMNDLVTNATHCPLSTKEHFKISTL